MIRVKRTYIFDNFLGKFRDKHLHSGQFDNFLGKIRVKRTYIFDTFLGEIRVYHLHS
jgi:hypothetical protein